MSATTQLSAVRSPARADHALLNGGPGPAPLVRRWLILLAALIAAMVVVGGFVRLTRSGLSIVEWNVITGVLPPIGTAAWEAEFAKYSASPEGMKVNSGMQLHEFQRIFYTEWVHRLFARVVGLVVAIPLGVFLLRGTIPWRRSGPYVLLLALFGFQGFLGWFMVASGLVDRPSVSHIRLTVHLLAALALLALCLWLALRHPSTPDSAVMAAPDDARSDVARARLAGGLALGVTTVQIAYGGLVAGLKAGHASDTWPLMFGRWVPAGLLADLEPAWRNLVETGATVHFVHRWLAWLVLATAVGLWLAARRAAMPRVAIVAAALCAVVAVQIGLGIMVVVTGVPIVTALTHQATGVAVFVLVVLANLRLNGAG